MDSNFTAEEQAWIRLLDDRSSVVRDTLLNRIKDQGQAGIAFLKEIEAQHYDNYPLLCAARSYLHDLESCERVDVFRSFIRSFSYELETGCLMLERVVYPNLSYQVYDDFLEEISERVQELLSWPMETSEACRILSRVFFHEYEFKGDLEDFYNPENSFLSQVIERRKGIPISLSCLYLLVAERCDIQLRPVSLPGKFMLGSFEPGKPVFFVDVFDGGVIRDQESVSRMLEGYEISVTDSHFAPCNTGEVLIRMCRNLACHYEMTSDPRYRELFIGFIREFEETYHSHANS